MPFRCDICDSQFEEKRRLEIHKRVHARKSKAYGYGSTEFDHGRGASVASQGFSI
jgi:hypothetical protein